MEAARRAAALSPTDETALRRLIVLLERVGDRAAAVRAYEAFASGGLKTEYELEPSGETQKLFAARIRAEPGENELGAGTGATPPVHSRGGRHGNPNAAMVPDPLPSTHSLALIGSVPNQSHCPTKSTSPGWPAAPNCLGSCSRGKQ